MILNYNIQNLKTQKQLLGIAFQTLNKTDVFNYLRDLPELCEEVREDSHEGCLFYIEDEEGVVFTRFINDHHKANIVKDKLVNFIYQKKSSFSKFKEALKEFASAASYAAHR